MPEVDGNGTVVEPPDNSAPELNQEEWGNGDIIISDDDGRWIQAEESVCIPESNWQ